MSNFRKFISMSAVAVLGVTNLLTPLSYASAATVDDYDGTNNPISTAASFSFLMPDHHVYLKATTEPNRYSVTYSGTTKTSGTMDDSWYTYDLSGNLNANAYEKIGYTFSGWRDDLNNKRYADKAEIKNLTTAESGNVPIYAEWSPNTYSIDYALNDASGTVRAVHNDPHPNEATYDDPFEVSNPTRTGYTFSGWTITNMDSHPHTVGGNASSATGASGVKGTGFNNLRATSGTVHFAAKWTANKVPYKVEHYLQDLSGAYSILSGTDNLTGTADTEVKPATGTYTGFKPDANTPYSGNIKPDGTQVFTYKYDRQSYELELIAGRGIMTATAKGTVNTTGAYAESGQTDSTSFKYDEPVTLAYTLKPGYQSGTWSGYKETASSFDMPAQNISKTAYATPITYTITLYPRVKNGQWIDKTEYDANSGSYTVESPDITLINPKRKNSQFEGWTGTGYPNKSKTVTIPNGSIGDRVYYATWSCDQGYHLSISGDVTSDECVPDENTPYTVRYVGKDLSDNNITLREDELNGVTDTRTGIVELDFVGFTPAAGNATGIKITASGSKVDILYTRNQYTINTPATTGVTYSATPEHTHEQDKAQYEDTVTINGDELPGYTFDHWEVKDASGVTVTVSGANLLTGATFEMPASEVTITPVMKKVGYTITYELHSGSVAQANKTGYNVETPTFTLNNPTRDHSEFVGWSGTDISGTSGTVTIAKGSVGNRSYEAIWKCDTGYHANGADECVANNYTVTIDYKDGGNGGGTNTEQVPFTYDTTGTIENPEQSGYDFAGWIVNGLSGGNATVDGQPLHNGETTSGTEFKNLTTEEDGTTVTLTATWTPRNDTHYVVYHYYENVENANYTLSGTNDYYDGTTDDTVTFDPTYVKNKSGFQYVGGYTTGGTVRPTGGSTQTTKILKDGSTEIYLYYQRSTGMVHLSGDEHISALYWTRPELYSGAKEYKYEATVNVSADAATGYHFKYWLKKKDSSFNEDL